MDRKLVFTKNWVFKESNNKPKLYLKISIMHLCLAALQFIFFCFFSITALAQKERVVILTDMTHDDGNSLIRYLHYANEFDTEAIIITPQLPDYPFDALEPWQKGQNILDGYKKDYKKLSRHYADYPTPESLQAVTKKGHGALPIIWLTNTKEFKGKIADRYVESSWGNMTFHDWIGEGLNPNGLSKDSEGSNFLVKVFEKEDSRPIFVQLWGGPITFVQALYRFQQKHSKEEFNGLLSKLHIFGILLQDITADYFINLDAVQNLHCTNMGDVVSSYQARRVQPAWVLHDGGHFWHYVYSKDPDYRKPITPKEVKGHGFMTQYYDNGGEGDTPSFLYLLSAHRGMNDPLDPTQSSWGSRFVPMGEDFPKGYFHTCGVDKNELIRWVEDARNSFLNRLLFTKLNPRQVNHEPIVRCIFEGKAAAEFIKVKSGQVLQLDASSSVDPDGNELLFNWYVERNGSLNQIVSTGEKFEMQIPLENKSAINVLLEVKDNGAIPLTSYKRFQFFVE